MVRYVLCVCIASLPARDVSSVWDNLRYPQNYRYRYPGYQSRYWYTYNAVNF